MNRYKVVATTVTFGKINKEPLERLQTNGCDVITNPFGRPFTNEEFVEYAADADALIVGNDKVTLDVITHCRQLKVIAKHGVGCDGIDVKAANKRGIVVTYAPGSNAEEVSDLAFGLMLMSARGLYQANRDTKAGKWIKPIGMSLYQKTIGIIGLGHIGCCTAKRAKGFSMKVLGYDIFKNPNAVALGVKFVPLDDLLQQADFISLHLPLTAQTRNLLNRQRIQNLKSNCVIVNTARSQLVDYDALTEALQTGSLKGYATDVYESEPPEHLPLFDCPKVIVTPHIGGTTIESNLRMGDTAVDNVLAVLRGEKAPDIFHV
jgi:D-3-phosphoglycerate dehydrogenase